MGVDNSEGMSDEEFEQFRQEMEEEANDLRDALANGFAEELDD